MEEKIIMEGLANRIKSALYVQNGYGMLTNQRFIYSKHSFAKIAIMSVFVNLTKGDYEFDIPISEIREVIRGRQGLSKNVLVITTKSDESFKFAVTRYMEWEIAFKNVLSNSHLASAEASSAPTTSNADEILKYKGLLDSGIITQEEFDAKKKKLLDL